MLSDHWSQDPPSKYPREDCPLFSQYTREEICACLDKWYAIEEQLEAIYPHIPDSSPFWKKINALEEVHFYDIRVSRGVGSQEMYPVRKWEKLIKQHERLLGMLHKEGY